MYKSCIGEKRISAPRSWRAALWVLLLPVLLPALGTASEWQAADYLVVEAVEASSDGEHINARLRNISDQLVTAWCLEIGGGPSDGGSSIHSVSSIDRYAQFEPENPKGPLQPGESTIHELPVRGYDLSPDRFDRGDYSVLSVDVGCVFLDDGSHAGTNTEKVSDILNRRLAELRANLRYQRELESFADSRHAYSWLKGRTAAAPPPMRRPVVLDRPSEAELMALREQRTYERISTSGFAVRLHERLGYSVEEALDLVKSKLNKKIANGFRNLPAELHEQAVSHD